MIENGVFREDLYYRLNVIPLLLPSLRQRPDDIHELVRFFFERNCSKHGRRELRLPEELLERFSSYLWPGNVRELENAVGRIVALARGNEVAPADLPEFLQDKPARLEVIGLDLPPKGISLRGIEKEVLLRALQRCDWNQCQAARYLGLSRKTLIYRMHKHNLLEHKPSPAISAGSAVQEIDSAARPPSKRYRMGGTA